MAVVAALPIVGAQFLASYAMVNAVEACKVRAAECAVGAVEVRVALVCRVTAALRAVAS